MKHPFWKLAGVLLLAQLLSACGPMYTTRYEFTPPDDPQSRTCIAQCEVSRHQCLASEDLLKQQCEAFRDQQRWQYEQCSQRNDSKDCYRPSYQSCSANTERCDSMHRACYQACGGSIRSYRECTMNCDQIKE